MGTAGDPSELRPDTIRVLLVDDDSVLARALQRVLALQGFEVDIALDGRAALGQLGKVDYDVMLLDLHMAGMDGMEVFALTRGGSPPATIIHSAHIDVRTAVMATRAGVHDVMQKPASEDELGMRIRELATERRSSSRAPAPSQQFAAPSMLQLVGESPQLAALRDQVRRVAGFRDISVLIQGPTGTGKELVAQAVHALTSPEEPFVSVNCAAVPEQLFESELFGHEAGAFTSARAPRAGLFEEAGRGTLFLDEIGEMPLTLQAKLLRVLETRQFRRVGGSRTKLLGARVVSATNRQLDATLGGSLRPDLFFRLAGYAIRTPPLAERMADVPQLAQHFLMQFAERHRVSTLTFAADALAALLAHSWPGNVRELRAVIENAGIVARTGVVRGEDIEDALRARAGFPAREARTGVLPLPGRAPVLHATPQANPLPAPAPPSGPRSLPDQQRELILNAFAQSNQNLSRAALDLGIPRSTLRARLRRYGVR